MNALTNENTILLGLLPKGTKAIPMLSDSHCSKSLRPYVNIKKHKNENGKMIAFFIKIN